jgi:LacI family transcriptional regulator
VESRVRHKNWSVLLTYLQEDNDLDPPRLLALSGKADGLIIGEGTIPSSVLAHLARRLPVVIVAGDPSEQLVDVVMADNRSGTAALVTHLISEHGMRRLFHVGGPPSAPDARERRLALDNVLMAHPECTLIGSSNGVFSVQSGEEAGARLLAAHSGDLPDAVVCANDQMAIGVLQALAAAGVRVPEDVAVVGFDDIFVGGIFDPTLTTVHQPMRSLGAQACDRLLDRIAEPDLPPIVRLLPTELVLRRSCGCPPGTATRHPVEPLAAHQVPTSSVARDDRVAGATAAS